jgi:hypothetical protein
MRKLTLVANPAILYLIIMPWDELSVRVHGQIHEEVDIGD